MRALGLGRLETSRSRARSPRVAAQERRTACRDITASGCGGGGVFGPRIVDVVGEPRRLTPPLLRWERSERIVVSERGATPPILKIPDGPGAGRVLAGDATTAYPDAVSRSTGVVRVPEVGFPIKIAHAIVLGVNLYRLPSSGVAETNPVLRSASVVRLTQRLSAPIPPDTGAQLQ